MAFRALLIAALLSTVFLTPSRADESRRYEVVIAGGSTAALAAAFVAAEEGARVALLEPTDWIGGQLTASGVPAVDEAWHKVPSTVGGPPLDVSAIARDPRNMTPFFRDALLATGNPGAGWVSRFCFEPRPFLERFLLPRERVLADRLTVFRETVVKRVETDGRRVTAITAIRRTPRAGVGGYDRPPSRDLADWYSPEDSDRFAKQTLRFEGAVFIDATEWGEVLALTGAPMLQGVEFVDGQTEGDDQGGQSITYGFVQRLHAEPVADHPELPTAERLGLGPYRDRPDAWRKIWTYRRLRGAGSAPAYGDLSLQNWGYSISHGEGGNDYPFEYLFLSREETARQRADWHGGVNLEALAAAERRALAWHEWFRHRVDAVIDGEPVAPDQITLEGAVLGTGHGLSKLPYIRDTRRSIGVGGFLLTFADLIGPAEQRTGTVFPDRVALGAYAADIHPLVGCEYPAHVLENHPTLPFYLPLRALTNDGFDNLLVAGKTMAQTFVANSATRLHPIEWSSGAAAGVVAADLARSGATTAEACDDCERLRVKIARHTPVDWTLPE